MNIAVLMPVFNESNYIGIAIDSILDFSYPDGVAVRLYVVDDFSTDDTLQVAQKKIEQWGAALVVLRNDQKGKNFGFNKAYSVSTEEYICLMGGDDRMVPDVLVKRAKAVDDAVGRDPSVKYVSSFCKIKTFSENPNYNEILIPKGPGKGSESGGALMVNRLLAEKIFPLPTHLPSEDTWTKLFFDYFPIKKVHLSDVGLLYRIHDGNSHKRGIPFGDFRRMMWARSRAYITFYERFYGEFDSETESKYLSRFYDEVGRYLGYSAGSFFNSGLSLRERIISLTYSNRFGYWIKQKLYRYLAGK